MRFDCINVKKNFLPTLPEAMGSEPAVNEKRLLV